MVAEYYMNDCPYAVTNWRHQLDELKAQFLKLENWFSLFDLDIFSNCMRISTIIIKHIQVARQMNSNQECVKI